MNKIVQGTTPTVRFRIRNLGRVDLNKCTQIWITIVDSMGREHFWDLTRITINAAEGKISVKLTQQETLAMVIGMAVAQVRFLYQDGSAFPSKPKYLLIRKVRKGGVIS